MTNSPLFWWTLLMIANHFIILSHAVLFWVYCYIPFLSYCTLTRRKKCDGGDVPHVLQAVKNMSEQSQVQHLSETYHPIHPSDYSSFSPEEPVKHPAWQIWISLILTHVLEMTTATLLVSSPDFSSVTRTSHIKCLHPAPDVVSSLSHTSRKDRQDKAPNMPW